MCAMTSRCGLLTLLLMALGPLTGVLRAGDAVSTVSSFHLTITPDQADHRYAV